MNIHELLNILVLTLSLATVLITLLTFLLHKIRQLPKYESTNANIKTEGMFFTRYLGKNTIETSTTPKEAAASSSKRIFRGGYQAFFAILCIVIFFSIFFERNISQWKRSRSSVRDAEIFKDRASKGLMKEYDLNPNRPNPELTEALSDAQKKKLAQVTNSLKKKSILVVRTAKNISFNHDQSEAAFNTWKKFLDFSGLKYGISSKISDGESMDILILPEAKSLSQSERSDLDRLAQRGVGILATGPVGYLDGTGAQSTKPWGGEVWQLAYIKNEDPKSFFPTLFSAGIRAPWWEVPPGLLLNWHPRDNGFQFTTTAHSAMAFEANYQGRERRQDTGNTFVRAVFGNKEKLPLVWFAFDPPDMAALGEVDRHYVSSVILESLLWATGTPLAKISVWKSGLPGALVMSVDSEDQFKNAYSLMEIFKKDKIPATFFTVSNLLKAEPELALEASEEYEIASHTDDHAPMKGKALSYQFDHIQNSRFAIEYLTGKKLTGFRPPEEGFDGTTLNAVLQNHIRYIFGDQHFHRFAPVPIAEGRLTYFPRSSLDDFNLISKNGIYTEAQAIQSLYEDHVRIRSLGGAHFLNLHTQIYGKPENWGIIQEFIGKIKSENIWKTNFEEMHSWWQSRDNISVSLIEGSFTNEFSLKVVNRNEYAVKDVGVQLSGEWQELSVSQSESRNVVSQSAVDSNLWIIDNLGANQELILNFNAKVSLRRPASAGAK